MGETINTTQFDRDIMDLIKDNILLDKKREEEYTSLLKDYINYLKDEIYTKNNQIDKQLNMICKSHFIETRSSRGNDILNSSILTCHNNTPLNNSYNPIDETGITQMNDGIKKCNHDLISENNENVNDIVYEIYEKDDINPCNQPINKEWITERRKKKVKHIKATPSPISIESINNYNVLYDENNDCNTDDDNRDESMPIGKELTTHRKNTKSRVFINQNPDRDTMGKAKRSKNNISKCVIISDSITKRIYMVKFNNELTNTMTLKRAFPGATTSQLNHFVKASLNDDRPDKIIICGGTNNLTKKSKAL